MEGAARGKTAKPPSLLFPRNLGSLNSRNSAGNHYLSRRIVISGHQHIPLCALLAQLRRRRRIRLQQRTHGTGSLSRRLSHGRRAGVKDAERIFQRHHLRQRQSADLSQREPQQSRWLYPAGHKGPPYADGQGGNGRLGIAGVAQRLFPVRAFGGSNRSHITPHQANERIIRFASKKMGVPMERFQVSIEEVGNTSASSALMALADAFEGQRIHPGDKVILVGFGAGLAYGALMFQA